MRRHLFLAALVLAVPSLAIAQDSLAPGEAKLGAAPARQAGANETSAIEAWLKGYDAAFVAKDLEKLATFYLSVAHLVSRAVIGTGVGMLSASSPLRRAAYADRNAS
jgi:hypothetical protein